MPRRKIGIGYGVIDTTFPPGALIITGSPASALAAVTSGVLQVAGAFPEEFSLSRPLLQNNPTALLAGEDWQGLVQSDLAGGRGGSIGSGGPSGHNILISDSQYSTVGTPDGTFRAELVADTTFGQALRHWQTDGGASGNNGYEMRLSRSWSGRAKVWYRFTMKYQPGFTNDGNPVNGGARAWKFMFAAVRHYVYVNNFAYSDNSCLNPPAGSKYSGSESDLPGYNNPGGNEWYHVIDEFTDGEWYEYTVCEEYLGSGTWRVRRWTRRLTTNGVIDPQPHQAKFGQVATGSNIPSTPCNRIQLGITDNESMDPGTVQWYQWGPFEAIDAAVIPDPYGLAADMLT